MAMPRARPESSARSPSRELRRILSHDEILLSEGNFPQTRIRLGSCQVLTDLWGPPRWNEADYFDDIPDEKIPKDMLDLASHIVKTKAGHFDPSRFEDQYEGALNELLKKKQEGKPIERPERPKPTNVVNLLEALQRSVEAGGASTSKAKGHAPARRTANEKTEQPKRKKTRRTG